MSKKLICGVLAPVMFLHLSASVLAGGTGPQAFITSATPISQEEANHYSLRQTEADQNKLLCQGADSGDAAIAGFLIGLLIVAVIVAVIAAQPAEE